jgi:hypothetical protein
MANTTSYPLSTFNTPFQRLTPARAAEDRGTTVTGIRSRCSVIGSGSLVHDTQSHPVCEQDSIPTTSLTSHAYGSQLGRVTPMAPSHSDTGLPFTQSPTEGISTLFFRTTF